MLAVDPTYRRFGLGILIYYNSYLLIIGRKLVRMVIDTMKAEGADEIILETEITNLAALKLYESFAFIRDKRLLSYYLNGNDAFKLKLHLTG